ncbi:Crp/Fnr family transcriptional regulator [Actinosynnema sp. NPDC023658]|uniref:Crp/Fnr family transcriptional regulator n=1 Tax=Actinosynnema sp. NPDC023658 TaxID=3155465 RepID=UPI0033C03453
MTNFMAQLSAGERDELYRSGRRVSYSAGEMLMREGDPGDHVLVIAAGDVRIVKSEVDGKEHLLNICGSGELVGEIACVEDNGRRSASVIALSPGTAIKIAKDAFVRFLHDHPTLWLWITRRLSALLRSAEAQSDRKSIRVLRAVATLTDRYANGKREVIVPCTQKTIAGFAHVAPLTAHRVLSDLKECGLAFSQYGKIVVPCVRCLRAAIDDVMSTQIYGQIIIGCRGTGACPRE